MLATVLHGGMQMTQLSNTIDFRRFDFNAWMVLAKSDPDEFEQRRRLAIEEFLSRSDCQYRLRCLQWRIDMERRKYRHPLVSCVRLYNMMWDSVYALQQLTVPGFEAGAPQNRGKSAKILPFRR